MSDMMVSLFPLKTCCSHGHKFLAGTEGIRSVIASSSAFNSSWFGELVDVSCFILSVGVPVLARLAVYYNGEVF